MNHDVATRLQAAERYVAGELSSQERDQFEEHFFLCPDCAGEVRVEQAFAANAKAICRERVNFPEMEPARNWFGWIPRQPALRYSLAFNLVLVASIGYYVAANRPSPQFYPAFFAPGPARSAEQVRTLPPGARVFVLRIPAPEQPYATYSYEVLNGNGRRELSGSLPAPPEPGPELCLSVPTGSLADGVHTLVLRPPGSTAELTRFQFRTQR